MKVLLPKILNKNTVSYKPKKVVCNGQPFLLE